MGITTAQIRGARGLLDWSQAELSRRTGISTTSIGNIESGHTQARESTMQVIEKAFEGGGIEFVGREGLKLKSREVTMFQGERGFTDFFNLVYETVLKETPEILVSNVEEKSFLRWAEADAEQHMSRMQAVKGLKCRVLLREGDVDFAAADYAEYRWLPQALFGSVPFYVFGKNLGILLLEGDPVIIVIHYPAVADAYKLQFDVLWNMSKVPVK